MNLKLNVKKEGLALSPNEVVNNEEFQLNFGHIFRGPKGDSGEKGDNGKSPKISNNGTWLVFSDEFNTYVDTGIKASGSDNNYTDADRDLVQTIPNKVDYDTFNTAQENIERTIESLGEHLSEVGEHLSDTKADKRGYYKDLSVGMADNLVGRGDVQDAQISFRPSAGADNISDGAARIERIKGNSVVWNQRFTKISTNTQNGVTCVNNGDGSFTVYTDEGGATAETSFMMSGSLMGVLNHILLISGAPNNNDYYLFDAWNGISVIKNKIYKSTLNTSQVYINVRQGTIINEPVIFYPQFIDLTTMFGAGNEPKTVEEYYQRKPMNIEEEFAYNAGELVDMKVESLISTSDNAYDYTKGYARVMGGVPYTFTVDNRNDITPEEVYFSKTLPVTTFEENVVYPNADGTYTFPSIGYTKASFQGYEVGKEDSICICLKHSYEKPHPAYQQEVKDLGWIWEIKDSDGNKLFENGMRDIPKTTHSTRGVCDEILYNPTKKKWVAIKRIERVEGLQWSLTTYPNTFAIRIDGDKSPNDSIYAQRRDGIRSNKYGISYSLNYNTMDDKTMLHYDRATSGYSIFIKDTAYATAAEFNEANKDLVIYYELAKPIVVELDYPTAETNMDYLVWDFGTEEAIVPNNAPSAPFRADINYEPNAVDDLRWAVSEIRNLKAQLAQMSASVTNLTE